MKKILIVSDTPTHPVTGGNRACIIQNADLLREMGYDVYFLYVNNYDAPESCIQPTSEYWGDHFFLYKLPARQHLYRRIMLRLRPKLSNRIDFLFPWGLNEYVDELHKNNDFRGLLVNYVWMSKLAKSEISVKALYTHDVFSNRAERVNDANYTWRTFPAAEEAKGIRRFRNILAIQSNEALYFRYLAPRRRVSMIYSPVKFRSQELALNHNILFFSGGGSLNLNGLKWFVNNAWPIIKEQDKEARLLIGGGICSELEHFSDSPDIEIVGRVDDPSEFYRRGDVVINPVFQGTGLKIKTLEGIAFGKCVVSTSHSAEGLYESDTLPIRIADNPQEFAKAILSNLGNSEGLKRVKSRCCEYISKYNSYIKSVYSDIFGVS